MSQRSFVAASTVLSAPFIVCALVLSAAAVGEELLVRWAGGAMHKEPLPLRKPLDQLDRGRLGNYRLADTVPISSSVEQALGTEEYIDWLLEDTSTKNLTDPRRYAHLTVTYYTGTQDPVPHTPDVCYLGGGYSPKQGHETVEIDVPGLGNGRSEVPIRVCTFVKTAIHNREEPTVVYTFHANGRFAATRDAVRSGVTDIRIKHAYFSKVEVAFGSSQSHPRNLGRKESVAAAAKLFNAVLPILLSEHWPDWQAVERSDTQPPASSGT